MDDSEPDGLWKRLRSIGSRRPYLRPLISVFATLALAALLVLALGVVGIVDLSFLATYWTSLGGPAFLSVALTTVAFATGLAAAVPLGALRAHGRRAPRGSRTPRRGLGRSAGTRARLPLPEGTWG